MSAKPKASFFFNRKFLCLSGNKITSLWFIYHANRIVINLKICPWSVGWNCDSQSSSAVYPPTEQGRKALHWKETILQGIVTASHRLNGAEFNAQQLETSCLKVPGQFPRQIHKWQGPGFITSCQSCHLTSFPCQTRLHWRKTMFENEEENLEAVTFCAHGKY